jgi:steroid 5-alpha reductase family enzyme
VAVAAAVMLVLDGHHPLWRLLAADVAATVAVFGASRLANNSSFYDPYWSVAPPIIAGWLALQLPGQALRQAVVVALVTLWGLRLTYSWARGWTGLGHEDWRYVDLRRSTGGWYWAVSLAGLHMMPTLLVFAGCLSLWPALGSPAALGWLDGVALLIMMVAIYFEARADRELHLFRTRRADPTELLETGLWRYSRHPNYFGELLIWIGLFVFGLAANPDHARWTASGPVLMLGLFLFISIPMIEKRMASKPGYAERQARVSVLFPWPPKS